MWQQRQRNLIREAHVVVDGKYKAYKFNFSQEFNTNLLTKTFESVMVFSGCVPIGTWDLDLEFGLRLVDLILIINYKVPFGTQGWWVGGDNFFGHPLHYSTAQHKSKLDRGSIRSSPR